MEKTALKYLGKSDVDKSFEKLKKEKTEFLLTDYKKCTETIKKLTEDILSKYNDHITVHKGNLQDITNEYKNAYVSYREKEEDDNKRRYRGYTNYYTDIKSEEEYIKSEIKYHYRSAAFRFKKYTPTREEEQKVLYFSLEKEYFSRSKFSFSFCAYYNSEHILCLDKITFKSKGWEEADLEFDTVKISTDKIIWLLESFLLLNKKGKENYKKRQIKQGENKIKKAKINQLKRKAGIINVKKILDEIDFDYGLEEIQGALKIHISLNRGVTTVKIPKKNLNKSLEYLSGFVETILKAEKLDIYFRHLNI